MIWWYKSLFSGLFKTLCFDKSQAATLSQTFHPLKITQHYWGGSKCSQKNIPRENESNPTHPFPPSLTLIPFLLHCYSYLFYFSLTIYQQQIRRLIWREMLNINRFCYFLIYTKNCSIILRFHSTICLLLTGFLLFSLLIILSPLTAIFSPANEPFSAGGNNAIKFLLF